MQLVKGFIQRYPDDGAPVSQTTRAYLGYTSRNLYVAFVCYESSQALLRAHMVPRDALGDDDRVEVTLDTFHDQRHALLFQTNALGIQRDGIYTEPNGPDFSFDTVWNSWGRRTPFGYIVLMEIPFQSLRFRDAGPDAPQTWGIVLQRSIAHSSEVAFWPQMSRHISGRLTQDAPARGFREVQSGHNMQFIPYTLGQNYRRLDNRDPHNPFFDSKHAQFTAGLDAKIVIKDSLVLDATLNPDFSQVNINDPAPPNQRFRPYFQEQRPFFIENSNYFTTPINLFYTLNIVSPEFGARLSGKKGPWAVGLLATDDRSPGQAVAPTNSAFGSRAEYYVARLAHDVGKYSSVGMLYTDRECRGSFNRLGGLDYQFLLTKQWSLTGQAVTSATRHLSTSTQSGNSIKQRLGFTGQNLNFSLNYNDTGKGFLDETGFFRRPDIRETHVRGTYTFRPAGRILLAHGPQFYAGQDWDHTGLALDTNTHVSYNLLFRWRTSVTPFAGVSNTRLRPVDYAALTQNVEHRSQNAGLNVTTSPVPQFFFSATGYAGQTVNYAPPLNQPPQSVYVQSLNTTVELKPTTQLDLENRYEFDRFRNPGSPLIAYDNHLIVERWNLQLNKALSVRLIGVYEATLANQQFTRQQTSKDLFGNALISYVPHPGTAVYIGYTTDGQNLDRSLCTRLPDGACNPSGTFLPKSGSGLINDSRTFYLKLSYLLRF